MPRFHKLAVTDIQKTTRDAVVVSLTPIDDADFDFIQGQYLTFRQDFDGVEVRRSYSICAGRQDGHLQVGIKKVAGGAFSTWANERLEPGMVLEAMAPAGGFHTALEKDASRTYLGFAGGSGITPVLSIIKTTLSEEPLSQFTLIYANRNVGTIMFREELEDLKNHYMGRLNIVHILESAAGDIDIFQGRIDTQKCDALFAHWIDINTVDTAFICGPEPMMLTIVDALKAHGLDDTQIKFELFTAAQHGQLKRPPKGETESNNSINSTKATIILDGTTHNIEIPADSSVLEAALHNAIDAPFACKAGVCSSCKCKLIKGDVEMLSNHSLEDYEVTGGYILSCQSFALTDELIIDYDQH